MTVTTRFVDYTDGAQSLRGYLASPGTSGRRPAVLVSHAWGGRSPFENAKADWVAELGYVGFALDCYGAGVLGTSPEQNTALMQPFLEDRPRLLVRLRAALATLRAQPEVDPERIAIFGFCFGGLWGPFGPLGVVFVLIISLFLEVFVATNIVALSFLRECVVL